MGRHATMETYQECIQIMKKYKEELIKNEIILVNAGSVCSQTMGSDETSKIQIKNMEKALKELKTTKEQCDKMIEELTTAYQGLARIIGLGKERGGR